MALQMEITTGQGFTAYSAYARIKTFNGDKDTIMVDVEVHKDSQSKIDQKQPIGSYNICLPLALGATMAQMYVALKLNSNFVGAIDV